eukprot:g29112.t1
MTALALVGCATYAYKTMPKEVQQTSSVMQSITEWEEIPGIDNVIEQAKRSSPKVQLRSLNDLFYESQPEELPWIRTECVIDVIQGAAYLGQAVVFLYKAIDYDGLKCPNNSPVGCAASVAGFITSISWIASLDGPDGELWGDGDRGCRCEGRLRLQQGLTIAHEGPHALGSNFLSHVVPELRACDDSDDQDWIALLHLTDNNPLPPNWQAFVPAGAAPTVETIAKVDALRTSKRNRNFDLTQCVMADVTNAAAYIVRVILQIRSAASACPEPRACAINILNIISSFAWISQFTALAVSDCWTKGRWKALCAADISDMVAAVTNGPAAGIATTSDCADLPDPLEEEKHLPMD